MLNLENNFPQCHAMDTINLLVTGDIPEVFQTCNNNVVAFTFR